MLKVSIDEYNFNIATDQSEYTKYLFISVARNIAEQIPTLKLKINNCYVDFAPFETKETQEEPHKKLKLKVNNCYIDYSPFEEQLKELSIDVSDCEVDIDFCKAERVVSKLNLTSSPERRNFLMSFSYTDDLNGELLQKIWSVIQQNDGYFKKIWGDDYDEAEEKTLHHALWHFDPSKGNLNHYILKLAKTIMREKEELHLEGVEGTVTSEDKMVVTENDIRLRGAIQENLTESLAMKNYNIDVEMFKDVVLLMLNYTKDFMVFSEFLASKERKRHSFSEEFIEQCLEFDNREEFFEVSVYLYSKYRNELDIFLQGKKTQKELDWVKGDTFKIRERFVNNTYLYNKRTREYVKDADDEEIIAIIPKGFSILKIDYFEAWDALCNYIADQENSDLRLTIEGYSLQRTPGGTITSIREATNLNLCYDLLYEEVLTNILTMYYGKIVHIGSSSVYILIRLRADKIKPKTKALYGMTLDFIPQEVKGE